MNLGDLDLQHVPYNHPRLQHSTSRHSIAASNGEFSHSEADYAADTESVTTAETVVRWSTPPPKQSPIHENSQSEATVGPVRVTTDIAAHATTVPSSVWMEEPQMRSREAEASDVPIMDEFDSAPPTPNTDDTPYIRFAIDQLTRDQDVKLDPRPETGTSEESYPVERVVPDEGLGYVQSVKKVKRPAPVEVTPNSSKIELFIPVEPQLNSPRYPDLTFVPRILRPVSIVMLASLCLLMIIALMFCAIYSNSRDGLVNYTGGISGAQYFLFQFVPQILAALLLLYIERVILAVARMVPYTMMASDDSQRRSNALFVDLYPNGFFWPRFDYFSRGESLLGICSILIWPVFFTIPLQSSLFSVIDVNGVWRWTTVQGVAWTLVLIYIITLISLITMCLYFFGRSTGLMWDPRSVADIIALLPRSNSLNEYQDTEILAGKNDFQGRLAVSSERLGYWRTNNALQEVFYCIGEEGAPTRRYTMQDGRAEKMTGRQIYNDRRAVDIEALAQNQLANPNTRFRYIPWFLNDAFAPLWPIAGFFLLLALIIISFLPSTALRNGFRPLVAAAPNSAGFSPANFLYSFVPSFLGLLIYSGFRSISSALFRLTPWASLSRPEGGIASESLLLNYTASNPLLTALTNRHYLVAFFSVLAPLTLLLPILAGGLFFPIQAFPSNTVLMLPNLPSFYVILVVLILALIGLISLAVSFLSSGNRWRYHLPHPVSCLAEIISFLYASDLVHDAAFRAVRSKADLRARLVGRRERSIGVMAGPEVRYAFGIFKGRDARSHLGVERVRRVDLR